MEKNRTIYLDNNATTPPDPLVVAAMRPFLEHQFANPSGSYTFARPASLALARAREQVAQLVGAHPEEIIFTSGGTESNNTALHSAVASQPDKRHVILSAVEHPSVLNYARCLESRGHTITVLSVNEDGALDLSQLEKSINDQTALVSVMTANNETGVIFPVAEIAEICHARNVLFHTDAVQAAGKIDIDLSKMSADFISLGAHKIHGPKGGGALYVNRRIRFHSYLLGGDQERGRRAGTENVAGLVGFGKAAELALGHLDEMASRVLSLRNHIQHSVQKNLTGIRVVGEKSRRLPNTVNLLIAGLASDALLALLDMEGICCSSGSACTAGASEPSHVHRAMGLSGLKECGALRISLSRFSTKGDVDWMLKCFIQCVNKLRTTQSAY